jgi:hypothetical protein
VTLDTRPFVVQALRAPDGIQVRMQAHPHTKGAMLRELAVARRLLNAL